MRVSEALRRWTAWAVHASWEAVPKQNRQANWRVSVNMIQLSAKHRLISLLTGKVVWPLTPTERIDCIRSWTSSKTLDRNSLTSWRSKSVNTVLSRSEVRKERDGLVSYDGLHVGTVQWRRIADLPDRDNTLKGFRRGLAQLAIDLLGERIYGVVKCPQLLTTSSVGTTN